MYYRDFILLNETAVIILLESNWSFSEHSRGNDLVFKAFPNFRSKVKLIMSFSLLHFFVCVRRSNKHKFLFLE